MKAYKGILAVLGIALTRYGCFYGDAVDLKLFDIWSKTCLFCKIRCNGRYGTIRLTRLYNRGALFEKRPKLAKRYREARQPFSVIQLISDYFKALTIALVIRQAIACCPMPLGSLAAPFERIDIAGRVGAKSLYRAARRDERRRCRRRNPYASALMTKRFW